MTSAFTKERSTTESAKSGQDEAVPEAAAATDLLAVARRALRQVDLGQALFPGHLCSAGMYMLIDLFVARQTRTQVTISGACIAGRVPATTGLRWIKLLSEDGLVRRRPDPVDRRRHLVELTDKAERLVAAWLEASCTR